MYTILTNRAHLSETKNLNKLKNSYYYKQMAFHTILSNCMKLFVYGECTAVHQTLLII